MIIKIKNLKRVVFVGAAFAIASCAPPQSLKVTQASKSISQSLGCSDMKSLVFDSFYEMIDQGQSVPLASDMKKSLRDEMNQVKSEKNLSADEVKVLDQITSELFTVIDLMLEQTPDMTSKSWKEQIQKIIEYEMQDQSTAKVIDSQLKINRALDRVSSLSQAAALACNMSYVPSKAVNASLPIEVSGVSLATGVNRVFATAYQSCRVLDLPPMDASTPNVVGITRTGTHADGIGGKREITDLKSVQKTHYYIRGIASENSCLKVASNPLIYDYGGSPAISGTTLNFFKNAGSGTDALGVDCSAFVSSAIAVVGMRYKPNLDNKPIYTRQTSSKFIDAAQSGFTCFDNVTVTPKQSIVAGDILGISGHVVIVDRVGKDPFGLASISKEADCSNLNYKNFDIVVAQSSPSKNGIGLNKFDVRNYLDETTKIRTAFVEMGKQACLAKFQQKNIKPKSASWGFIRHKGTTECLAPRVSLEGETCAKSCF